MGVIISGVRQLSSQRLADRAARAASGLASLGVAKGDLVALYLRNDFAFFEASFAVSLLGAYSTPVNWHYVEAEARYLLEDSGAKVIVIHADLIAAVQRAIPAGVQVLVVPTPTEIAIAYNIDPAPVPEGMLNWHTWLESFEPHSAPPPEPSGSVIYTSGTTGLPKGVRRNAPTTEQAAISLRTVCLAFGFTQWLQTPSEIVTVITGPMYHSAPNMYGIIGGRIGAQIVLQARFDPEDLLRLIEKHRVTHLHLVPIMFNRLLRLPDAVKQRYDLSSLKFVVHASAPCPQSVKRAMIGWWGPIINEYYGSTETGIIVFCAADEWLSHPGTVGRPLPGADVRVIDANENSLRSGEIGEVVGKLAGIADFTYHGDDAKRRASEKIGLVAPGDIGYFDQDGFLYLCDRAKDMIISGGANIYPAEIEAELHKMPGVADCAVFGVPDDEFGEAVYAVVQPVLGKQLEEEHVRVWLRQRMSGYKVPKTVRLATELPREDSGKIFKRKLREPFWAGRKERI